MRKTGMLALAGICKNKGQSASFLFITLLAAILMNMGLVTAFDYSKSFDDKAKELETADAVFFAQDKENTIVNNFQDQLKKDDRTVEVESRPILQAGSEFPYADGKQSRQAIFLNAGELLTRLDRISFVDKSEEAVENPIYLPWLFFKGGGYKIGDEFIISLYAMNAPKQTLRFTVAGFFEETYLATINNRLTGFLLEEKEYRKLSENFNELLDGTMFSVRLSDRQDAELFTSKYFTILQDLLPEDRLSDSSHYAFIKSGRTLTSSIGAILIVCFAILITAVSLVILRFRIGNSIEEEMQNIGALKAIGYTSTQIRASILLQFVLLTLCGVFLGIAGSYAVLPVLSDMFAAQTGVLWRQKFRIVPAASTLLALLAVVAFVSLVATRRVKKLPPIVAMRSGILTHSFKKNFFPLDKTRGNLIFLLSGKNFCLNVKQNILIGFIVALVSFAAAFAGIMYYNITVHDEKFISLVAGEVSSAQVEAADRESAEKLLEEIRAMPETDRAFFYHQGRVSSDEAGAGEIYCYVTDNFGQLENQNIVYEGRFPKYENEAGINGLLAKKCKKKIGDKIELSINESKQEYLITGFIQCSNYMGHDACMTTEGYERLLSDFWSPLINVYLDKGVDTSQFLERLKSTSNHVSNTINIEDVIESSLGTYQSIVALLVLLIVIGTELIITLVLYLVLKTVLIRKRKEFGIQKAIGYTTWQLALQNACSFLDIVVVGTLLGCTGGYFWVNSFLSLLFSNIGMMKVDFMIPMLLLAGISLAITLTGFFISFLVSLRIRKITPYTLISE